MPVLVPLLPQPALAGPQVVPGIPRLSPAVGRALQNALRRAIATRRGYRSWDVDHAGWVVTLHSPDEQEFYGKTLEEALAWCLVWLMAPEIGVGPYFWPDRTGDGATPRLR